jgi:hypothetical protein
MNASISTISYALSAADGEALERFEPKEARSIDGGGYRLCGLS